MPPRPADGDGADTRGLRALGGLLGSGAVDGPDAFDRSDARDRPASRLPAEGQGTMNNLVLGGRGWTYYETIGGGQGASAAGPGPSGVHVGMSNTLNTPVEALELEYPLRVERYELVEGSGGEGEHRGGEGIARAVRTLEDASLSLVTDRRRHAPQGRDGGEPGRPGVNLLDGEELAPKASRAITAGSVVEVRTPGGGGWGARRS